MAGLGASRRRMAGHGRSNVRLTWARTSGTSCAGFDCRAPGCEPVRAATLGELWNEATNGIVNRLPDSRNMMDSKGRWPLARSGVRNARKVFWMRETTTEGRFAKKFRARRGGVGRDLSAGQSSSGSIKVMAGCGSSMSSAPQVAMSLTSRAARLSLRT